MNVGIHIAALTEVRRVQSRTRTHTIKTRQRNNATGAIWRNRLDQSPVFITNLHYTPSASRNTGLAATVPIQRPANRRKFSFDTVSLTGKHTGPLLPKHIGMERFVRQVCVTGQSARRERLHILHCSLCCRDVEKICSCLTHLSYFAVQKIQSNAFATGRILAPDSTLYLTTA